MDCGGCQNFQKWKNDKYGGGVCLLHDSRTKTDYGHKCKEFKKIPYDRKESNNEFKLIQADAFTA